MTAAHRSLPGTLMIDCLDECFDESLAFWSEALGLHPPRQPGTVNGKPRRYVTLGQLEMPLVVRLQRVEKHAGLHLDIETDDIRAERARMLAAGARVKYRIKRWWVLEDPSGNAFCLVRPEGHFDRYAREVPDE